MAAMESQPGGVRGELPRGQVGEGPVVEVGVDLLDDGVVAVVALGLDGLERGVGEERVVAPGGEQLALPGGGVLVLVADPADDEAGGDRPLAALLEGGVLRLGDLGFGGPAAELVVPQRLPTTSAVYRCPSTRRRIKPSDRFI
jgi:hypothetical protein